ncbi:glycosyltransferase family 9 protein [Undibacterium sp. TJN25]|uniref:glycosyltransferase family 9 protein n=1 Tax=Undibacterium sp. TJN25 TaxID=3413056 RepID=UPI003BF3FC82
MQEIPAKTSPIAKNPFQLICHKFKSDLAVPNVTGIGDVLMYTRLVEEVAMRCGRPIDLLTGPIQPTDDVGTVEDEEPFPIWRGNPFVGKILNLADLSPESMSLVNSSHEQHCHFGHIISNICAEYGVAPRLIRPSLFLTEEECREALLKLSGLPRPVLCLHPYGTSSPKPGHPWHEDEWHHVLSALPAEMSVVEVGIHGRENKGFATKRFRTTLRQMMALVWASDMFLGFDSSVAHVATAFSKPAMVLWDPIRKSEIDTEPGMGPVAFSRWSYPQNKNLMLLGESPGEIRRIVLNWINDIVRSIGAQY